VKELKVHKEVGIDRHLNMLVESGEGIERRKTMRKCLDFREFPWNPVKELKDSN